MEVHCLKLEADDDKADMLIFGAPVQSRSLQQSEEAWLPGERLQDVTIVAEAGGLAIRDRVELTDFKD